MVAFHKVKTRDYEVKPGRDPPCTPLKTTFVNMNFKVASKAHTLILRQEEKHSTLVPSHEQNTEPDRTIPELYLLAFLALVTPKL